MNNRSQRGAARVSAVWLIVFLVLLIAALAFAYIAKDSQAKAENTASTVQTKVDELEKERETYFQNQRDLSELVGGYDKGNTAALSDLAAVKTNLQALKEGLGVGGDESLKDFQSTWPLAISQLSTLNAQVRTLQGQIDQLTGELAAAQASRTEVASTKDSEISTLRSQNTDLEQNARDSQTRLEGDLASARAAASQKDAELTELRTQMTALVAEADLNEAGLQSRIQQVTGQLRLPREPLGDDGMIVGVSKTLGLAYINKGRLDRMVRGMRFQVIDGSPTSNLVKGEVEVTEVTGDHMAEVKIIKQNDAYNRLVDGDVISNPLYDAEGNRNAVLAGRFSGGWNERELELLLGEIGITVQPKLDRSTTFLVVGEPLYIDPETGDTLEDPLPVSDLAVYKEAESMGCQIVHISEIRHYFRR